MHGTEYTTKLSNRVYCLLHQVWQVLHVQMKDDNIENEDDGAKYEDPAPGTHSKGEFPALLSAL